MGKIAALSRLISRATDRCLPFFRTLKKEFEWTPEFSLSVVSSALIRKEDGVQKSVYYTNRALRGAEERYPKMEKLTFALVMSARKLRPYFQTHKIVVWSISGVGLIIISPERENIAYALRFDFKATNNEAEYEALIVGLKLVKVLGVEQLIAYTDSQLIIPQEENANADALARLATVLDPKVNRAVPLEYLDKPSILQEVQKEGMDIIGPLPMGKGQVQYAIVVIDYFTKWIEAGPLASIAETSIRKFAWRSIINRFGMPRVLVTDNGKQFDCTKFKDFCARLGIKNRYSSPGHPQANGQAEVANKSILQIIKKKLKDKKGTWPKEFPSVLWAYRTTAETPFLLV
ncbi:uncharacterized protein LOC132304943 [Cornus florida]|uniref:uncharacterized protein LOC132304943 n=1 Tax=Cornus florida TaxID=4283 RepID=UPI00289BD0D8|nr:uncharacterized protein LOC132304943 [Cornus florida]